MLTLLVERGLLAFQLDVFIIALHEFAALKDISFKRKFGETQHDEIKGNF